MKDKKKLEVSLKVIKRIYDKNPGMQETIIFYFAVVFIIMATREQNLSKSV